MSLLVDDNEKLPDVQWTTPISSLIRDDFVLSDPWATEHITVEDALSHRTGYSGHTMGINNSNPRECTRRLRHLPMSAEPRTVWQYSNYMFTALGHAMEVLTSKWLGDVFRENLWEPMGMHHTYLRREDAERSGLSLAAEYWWDEDYKKFVLVPHLSDGRGREGAGMVISNVEDYSRYLDAMLYDKLPISELGHAALKTPRMLLPTGSVFEEPQFYSLGWAGGTVGGIHHWFHNGRIRKHVIEMRIVPQKQMSVVVMLNANDPAVASAMTRSIVSYYTERLDNGSWVPERPKTRSTRLTDRACRESVYPHVPAWNIQPAADLLAYTGKYHNAGYGDLEISLHWDHRDSSGVRRLKTGPMMGFDGLTFEVVFEHFNGEFWLGKAYILEHNSHKVYHLWHPEVCIRVETVVDYNGKVQRVGMDLRQEEPGSPLVWFDGFDSELE